MNKRALVTVAPDVPTHLKTWTSVDLGKDDLIIIVGEPNSPHEAIVDFIYDVASLGGPSIHYVHPDAQDRWNVSKSFTPTTAISQRVNVGILEALDSYANTITIIGPEVYPMTVDFFERVDSALRGSAPYWLVSSDNGWWNAGSLLDPPVTMRGFPFSQRHEIPQLTRQTELDDPIRVGVLVHQMLGEPDINAVEQITTNPEVKRYRADTNVVLAPGTWCAFGHQAVTVTRALAPLLFAWPFGGRYDDIWAGYLAQRAMQDLGRHLAFGFPLVRRDRKQPRDVVSDLSDELIGMRRTELITENLRNMKLIGEPTVSSLLQQGFESATKDLLLERDAWDVFTDWMIDMENLGPVQSPRVS